MARLNEVPAQTESFDALKRRFIRQNREIARANSTQSLKIRTLETETSQLLSENIDLREQIIRLQAGLVGNSSLQIYDEVDGVRARLDEKVRELGSIINELGLLRLPKCSKVSTPKIHGSTAGSPGQLLRARAWKNGFRLSEVCRNQEGRLAPIAEDKPSSKRTLSGEDVLNLFSDPTDPANTTDSPDLGPPPVAHFDTEEAVEQADGYGRDHAEYSDPRDCSGIVAAGVEGRRKRRESANVFEFRKTSASDSKTDQPSQSSSPSTSGGFKQPMKTSAKRKMSVREEGRRDSWRVSGADDPKRSPTTTTTTTEKGFGDRGGPSRLLPPHGSDVDKFTEQVGTTREGRAHRAEREIASKNSIGRRALGPKSTNTDPSSPLKQDTTSKAEAGEPARKVFVPRRLRGDQSRERQANAACLAPTLQAEEQVGRFEKALQDHVKIEPSTPAGSIDLPQIPLNPGLDLAGTTNSIVPSEAGVADHDPVVAGIRPARRPRAGINYAEPNLRDKMRRPTKELVDAVITDGRSRRGSSTKREDEVSTGEQGAEVDGTRAVVIKDEEQVEPSGKGLPSSLPTEVDIGTSRIANKNNEEVVQDDGPSSRVIGGRKSRSSTLSRVEDADQEGASTSGSQAAISRTTTGSKPSIAKSHKANKSEIDVGILDVYDLSGSSSSMILSGDDDNNSSSKASPEEEERATVPRISRRHSTVGNSIVKKGATAVDTSELLRIKPGGTRKTCLSSTQTSSAAGTTQLGGGDDIGSRSRQTRENSRITTTSSAVTQSSSSEASDRSAARRRSMMF